MPQPHNFNLTDEWRGQKLFRQYVDQQWYGALIAVFALGVAFVSWVSEKPSLLSSLL
jgi:hypothetical protein